jgi:hypothetical protein
MIAGALVLCFAAGYAFGLLRADEIAELKARRLARPTVTAEELDRALSQCRIDLVVHNDIRTPDGVHLRVDTRPESVRLN